MNLAGKYINDNRPLYEPDVFPDQRLMQMYASQTTNPILTQEAALEFQYPFKLCLTLPQSEYPDEIKFAIMQATTGTIKRLIMADKAIQKGYTKRYLPEKAWASLSKEERAETDQKKRTGSRQGKQFIPNTDKAKKAGRAARRYRDSK
jgi:hypothetical protein